MESFTNYHTSQHTPTVLSSKLSSPPTGNVGGPATAARYAVPGLYDQVWRARMRHHDHDHHDHDHHDSPDHWVCWGWVHMPENGERVV